MLLDIVCQRAILPLRQLHDRIARDVAVFRHIVAGHHAEGRQACVAAAADGRQNQAWQRARRIGMGQVVHNIGMIRVEIAAGGMMAVAFLGDRHRDNRHVRLTHGGDHRLDAVAFAVQRRGDHADNPRVERIVGHFRQAIEVILLAQRLNQLAAIKVNFAIAPVAALFRQLVAA